MRGGEAGIPTLGLLITASQAAMRQKQHLRPSGGRWGQPGAACGPEELLGSLALSLPRVGAAGGTGKDRLNLPPARRENGLRSKLMCFRENKVI